MLSQRHAGMKSTASPPENTPCAGALAGRNPPCSGRAPRRTTPAAPARQDGQRQGGDRRGTPRGETTMSRYASVYGRILRRSALCQSRHIPCIRLLTLADRNLPALSPCNPHVNWRCLEDRPINWRLAGSQIDDGTKKWLTIGHFLLIYILRAWRSSGDRGR
jgi:hypothetical protein